MAADGHRSSPDSSVNPVPKTDDSVRKKVESDRLYEGLVCDADDARRRRQKGELVISENVDHRPSKTFYVEGKGKEISKEIEFKTPMLLKSNLTSPNKAPENDASSSRMNIFVNRFGNSNAIPGDSVINANSRFSVSKIICNNDEMISEKLFVNPDLSNSLDVLPVNEKMPMKKVVNPFSANLWIRKPYIRLNFKEGDAVLTDDGKAVKLIEKSEMKNASRLENSLVAKVFGSEIPPHVAAWELRRQWFQFGQFHFTTP